MLAARYARLRGRLDRGSRQLAEDLEAAPVGEPLYIICRDPAMPSQGTVYNWLRIHPEFVEAYQHAKAVAFDFVIETAVDKAPWLGTEAASMRALARIERRAARRCGQLAPRTFAPGVYRAER